MVKHFMGNSHIWTLNSAKVWVEENSGPGCICPCCSQVVDTYRRSISGSMALVMMAVCEYQASRNEMGTYVHLWSHVIEPRMAYEAANDIDGRSYSGDYAKLRHWGLVEPHPKNQKMKRPAKKSAGMWRITPLGVRWTQDECAVPKYIHLCRGKCLKLSGESQRITQRTGTKFNYAELKGDYRNYYARQAKERGI